MPDAPLAKILIADDEPLFLRTTASLLEEAGYECTCAPSGTAASEALESQRFDLVLSDLNMPGNRSFEFLRAGRERFPETPLIVITGVPSLPTAIESLRLGIADYLLKPTRREDLLSSVRRALRHRETAPNQAESVALDGEILGSSPAMQQVLELVARVAESDANVLITGESGTGKEVVARAIHRGSARSGHPFQVVDCTAIPESLFESVLFGHARGAFTGAIRDQAGLLSQADGGTVFFDEIGELPISLQAKLLRVIQEPTFTPLGQTTAERIDARFLCATNRNLAMEVNAGQFRRDLFYRLAVIHIELPPLRERGDDVLLLGRHFLRTLRPSGNRVRDFAPETQKLLRSYPWPGNVRELRNAVEHALALARTEYLLPTDLPLTLLDQSAEPRIATVAGDDASSRQGVIRDAELNYLIDLLRKNSGNVARSAQQAGISRQGLHKLLKRHGIEAAAFRN